MINIWRDTKRIMNQKIYIICVTLTAVMSYGFAVCQPVIGIDDSAIGRYFDEGMSASCWKEPWDASYPLWQALVFPV